MLQSRHETIMKKIIKYFYYRTINGKFIRAWLGHSLGIVTHLKWRIYHYHCIRHYLNKDKNNDVDQTNINELNVTGGAIIGILEVREIANNAQDIFDKFNLSHNTVALRIPKDVLLSDFSVSVYKILEEISPVIESYYSCYFKPYFINIERNRPGAVLLDTSFGWHIDDNPKEIMKIFVYLNDVFESNGAFRAINYQHSYKLLSSGFISNESQARLSHQLMVNEYLKNFPNALTVFEGKAGTTLMFDNNLVHKGTAPIVGERIVLQIEVYPSPKKFSQVDINNAILRELVVDFPKNPYKNEDIR